MFKGFGVYFFFWGLRGCQRIQGLLVFSKVFKGVGFSYIRFVWVMIFEAFLR